MRRVLSFFIALIMLLGLVPSNVFAANMAKPTQTNAKVYEEVKIDGIPYKVYKVADLIEGPSEERAMSLMSRSAKPLGNPAPAQPYNGWKFFLKLTWETIDRPIDNVTIPVYVGDPTDSSSLKLGHFVVTTGANEDQYIEMNQEYFGTNPSIDYLVDNALSEIVIAVPIDMRYDFVLASTKWDYKDPEGTKGKDARVVFKVYGKQCVMHGYGIKWYDTGAANRDKVEARWEGKENQISDVKLGTEDRDYSVYKNNVIDTNDSTNVKSYTDGMKYSNYDYYYNGKKITTFADTDNLGKFDDEVLAISLKNQAPYASLKVKDGNDYKLKGEKVLKNNTKYLYNSVGDYRTFHVLSMREALEVKFNTGKGFLNDAGKTANKANQEIGTAQEIGHSETIANNESGRTITVPNGSTLIPPAAKAGKPANEFIGWALTADATTALFKTKDEANAYKTPFTDKTTTFYAIYGPKDQGKIKVEYKDSKTNAAIDSKYQLKGQEYPAEKKGDMGKAIKDEVFDTNKAPKFLGYKIKSITTDSVPNPPATANYTKNGDYTVIYTYDKLDDIIPEKKNGQDNPDVTPDVIEHYAKVTFQVAAADGAKAKLQLDGADATSPLVYYVNPLEGKTIAQVANVKAISKDDNLYKVDANDMWTYDPDTITSTGQVISQATDGEGNVVKTEITLTAKVAEKTAAKFKGKLEPQDIKVWVGDSIDWKTGVKLTDNSLKTEFNEAKFNDINNLTGAKLVKQADDTFKLVKSDGTTEVQDNELRNSSTATGSPFVGKILVTFSDGSSLEVSNQKLYVADKIVPNTNNPIVPDNAIKVVFANGDGVAAIKHEGYLVKPGTTLESSGTNNKFPTPVLDATKANDYKEEFAWSPAQNTAIAKPSTSNNYYTVVPNGHDVFKFTVSATPKGQSTVTVKYVDKNGTQLNPSTDSKLQIEGEVYPSTLTGKEGKDITYKKGNTDLKITERQNAPKILGYKLLDDDASTADKDDAFEFTSDKYAAADATVTIKYEKIDDIIKPTTPNEEKPAGYITVNFLADDNDHKDDKARGTLTGDAIYYVNPKAVEIDIANKKLSGKDKDGTAMNKSFPTFAVKNALKDTLKVNETTPWAMEPAGVIKNDKSIDLAILGNRKDINIIAQYQKETGTVTYEFESDDTTKTLPAAVKNQIPSDTDTHYVGDTVNVTAKTFTNVAEVIGGKQGTWKFDKWNKQSLTVSKTAANNKFIGTWKWVERQVRPVNPDHKDRQADEVEVIFKKGEHGTLSGLAIVNNVEKPVSGRAELAYYVKNTATWKDMEDYTPKAIGDANWTFSNWNPRLPEDSKLVKDGAKEFTAQYLEQDLYVTLTLDENYRGGRVSDYDAYQNDLIEGYLYRPRRKGYVFEGWSYNSRRLDEVRPGDRIEYSTTLYAIWSKQKAKDDEEVEPIDTREVGEHKAYMFGYTDGTVRPNGYITRAEAAALVTRLLGLDTFASAAEPAFTDTPSSWYNKAINAAVNRGIMKGYPDKSFRPNAPITRAEFTQMISTIDNKPYGVAPFADVVGHWAERPIGSEYQAGRIKGYPDGTFRPNAFITRAEAVVILNKIFERNYDAMSAMNAKNKEYIKRFIDLAPSFWGFNDMVEATNTHLFKRRVKGAIQEDWVEVK